MPYGPWWTILKVDVLNCMALAGAALAVMAVFRTEERARLCAVLGVAIAVLLRQLFGAGLTAVFVTRSLR